MGLFDTIEMNVVLGLAGPAILYLALRALALAFLKETAHD